MWAWQLMNNNKFILQGDMDSSSLISPSQSLFQVYYLSAIEVDRRCGSDVLSWIIEELKMGLETAQDMRLIWITLGRDNIEYVADSGLDIQHHPYCDIIRCTTGQDNVSFAYIIHSEKDSKSYCHVFQSLVPDEAQTISLLMKQHRVSMEGKNEPPVLPGNKLAAMLRQSKKGHLKFTTGRSLSSRRNSIDPSTDTLFAVTYCGSMPYNNRPINADTVDSYVKCITASNRPSSADRYKKWQRKKKNTTFTSPKTNTMFRLQSSGSDDVDYDSKHTDEDESDMKLLQVDDGGLLASKSLSDLGSIETGINPAPGPSPTLLLHSIGVTSSVDRSLSLDEDQQTRPRSSSGSNKLHESVKRKPWSFRGLKKSRSSSSADKTDSIDKTDSVSSLKEEDSPRSLQRYDSNSPGGSVGSLKESVLDEPTPPFKRASTVPLDKTTPPLDKTTPTPAIRVTDSLESSEEVDEDNDMIDGGAGQDSYGDKENGNFDMVPELEEISLDPEFSLLGMGGHVKHIRQQMSYLTPANLIISGTKLVVTTLRPVTDEDEGGGGGSMELTSVTLVEAAVVQVLCCSQGQNSPEYVAFVTRKKGTRHYMFHLVRSSNDKAGTGIVKAFKYAFEYGMVQLVPTYLCDTCPIRQLNMVCKELSKRSIPDSLLHIKDIMLSTVTESDYYTISKDYKKQPFENEHNQVVRWTTLLREFFHRRQSSHAHHTAERAKPVKIGKPPPSAAISRKRKLLGLSKLSGSHDSLKDSKDDYKNELDSHSSSNIQSTDSVSERVGSPLSMASAAILESQFSEVGSQYRNTSYSHDLAKFKNSFPTSSSFPPTSLKDTPTEEMSSDMLEMITDENGTPIANYKKGHKRSMSWRQQIFESVTPSKQTDLTKRRASIKMIVMETPSKRLSQRLSSVVIDENEEGTPSSRARTRWRWAIEQQILLVKLEKENQSVIMEETRWLKLSYDDPSVDTTAIGRVWSELIDSNSHSCEDLFAAVKMGIPPKLRERVWKLLASYYHSRHPGEVPLGNYPSSIEKVEYEAYKSMKTEYENVIVADIDRTFPTHPYFISEAGQKALHRVLHAYAVSDTECGYCQGLSFVAGIVLMHSLSEVEAFVQLNHLMFLYRFRDIYSQNMFVLQTKLYQFSRLLHDQHPAIHVHLEENDVSPFLYAAPWFLTIFSSQFPIRFVARVFDLVFFEGVEAIYKVSLSLLKHYQYDILKLDNMETITDFLKNTIPERVINDSSEILHSATQLGDLSAKLKTFETEYHVMHDLMSTFHLEKKVAISDTEAMNDVLRKQNKDLIEQVVMCRGAIMRLESNVNILQQAYSDQQLIIADQQQRLNRLEKFLPTNNAMVPNHVQQAIVLDVPTSEDDAHSSSPENSAHLVMDENGISDFSLVSNETKVSVVDSKNETETTSSDSDIG